MSTLTSTENNSTVTTPIISSVTQYVISMNATSILIPIELNSIACKLTLVDVQPMSDGAYLRGQLVQGPNSSPVSSNYTGMGFGIDAGGNSGFGYSNQQYINFWPNNRATVQPQAGVFGTVEIYNHNGDVALTANVGAPYAWNNQPLLSIQSAGLSVNHPVFGLSGIELMFTFGNGAPASFRQGTILVETFKSA